ncbi:hypothetical protein HNP99_001037 [Flavobacterium sp. 28A]|uniref:DUF4468 domain-containing protein n=1 Tax=Flavobacterium sp. 28A TaxID=2735895 RepID=UPI0015700AAC|nr:DUF4468 domain-containing protein [Flavobacterium sp. 28A]NRT14693.1 hypothetical protein [Flavobacterium sp. 28A]
MKKIILLALILFSTVSLAQKFKVTPNGLKDSENLEKSFVVIPIDGKTAKELYDESIKFINKNYKSPEDVIKGKTEGEFLKFETYASGFITIKNGWTNVPFSAKYTIELTFKDGKVKYEIIELDMYNSTDKGLPLTFTGGTMSWSVYNKKGELKKEGVDTSIENYFNGYLMSITNFMQGKLAEDKW